MSLVVIVKAVGGDLYDRGRRANIPAPGHGRHDRSVSLLLQDNRVVVHTFGGGDWREVLDHLRALKLIDAANTPMSVTATPAQASPALVTRLERRDAALRLWEGGRAIAGTASERYCRTRGLVGALPGSEVLRHNAETPVSAYRRGGYARAALLAAIHTAEGAFTAVEVTYLTAQGRRATDLRLSRKTIGVAPAGCAIRLDEIGDEMLVGEGVFTTRSASDWFGLPGWALGSTRNLRIWCPPAGVRAVLIAADRGQDGEASAERLRGGLVRDGLRAAVALPPSPYGDWNEWAVAVRTGRGREEGGRERAGAPRGRMSLALAQEPDRHD
ncbi:MAG: toprim domain-containing protein [Alphaproteobacteria bacterium]|nr:toprim domain-containing protein [Alphaproteobacteria bacterium]MBU1516526.1 toprim domain-containing protein [Alphaproteobacteria bacterium]MBU2094283.1 toprim domain-containing protein [Alphaproteobacteria bacterium]MBU2154140.1 toprim domain-containing protein [Alphaproteobacteria bacterium]MBU2307453.1 toprim domain-containing protein [Alphaproteobacteria bacterium]